MKTFAFLDDNRPKIGEKSEKIRSGSQYCWVMHSGSRVDAILCFHIDSCCPIPKESYRFLGIC